MCYFSVLFAVYTCTSIFICGSSCLRSAGYFKTGTSIPLQPTRRVFQSTLIQPSSRVRISGFKVIIIIRLFTPSRRHLDIIPGHMELSSGTSDSDRSSESQSREFKITVVDFWSGGDRRILFLNGLDLILRAGIRSDGSDWNIPLRPICFAKEPPQNHENNPSSRALQPESRDLLHLSPWPFWLLRRNPEKGKSD
jgi:hypothetical protein